MRYTLLIAAIICGVSAHTGKALTKEEGAQLSQYLKSFNGLQRPASFRKVGFYVKKLVAIDPARAPKYVYVGFTHVSSSAQFRRLANAAERIVRKSDLPASKKAKVINKIERLFSPIYSDAGNNASHR